MDGLNLRVLRMKVIMDRLWLMEVKRVEGRIYRVRASHRGGWVVKITKLFCHILGRMNEQRGFLSFRVFEVSVKG